MRKKAAIWVFEALEYVIARFPFPIVGIGSDNGSEFINHHLFSYCQTNKITFTHSRAGNSNDTAHVEQKNWLHVRTLVGYLRYDSLVRKLATMALTKAPAPVKPRINRTFVKPPKRRKPDEATNQRSRRY